MESSTEKALIAPTRAKKPSLVFADAKTFAASCAGGSVRISPAPGAGSPVLLGVAELEGVVIEPAASDDATGEAGRIASCSGPQAESAGTRSSIDTVTSHTR